MNFVIHSYRNSSPELLKGYNNFKNNSYNNNNDNNKNNNLK